MQLPSRCSKDVHREGQLVRSAQIQTGTTSWGQVPRSSVYILHMSTLFYICLHCSASSLLNYTLQHVHFGKPPTEEGSSDRDPSSHVVSMWVVTTTGSCRTSELANQANPFRCWHLHLAR